MTQKKFLLDKLPCTITALRGHFKRKGWAERSVTMVIWQLKKARKIKLGADGKFRKARG